MSYLYNVFIYLFGPLVIGNSVLAHWSYRGGYLRALWQRVNLHLKGKQTFIPVSYCCSELKYLVRCACGTNIEYNELQCKYMNSFERPMSYKRTDVVPSMEVLNSRHRNVNNQAIRNVYILPSIMGYDNKSLPSE